MKTFNDLQFNQHPIAKSALLQYENATQAVEKFDNGYGVSVVFGSCFYSNGVDTYELAVLFNDEITYSTHITDDVMGGLSKGEVTEVMIAVQNLTA